MQENEVQFLFTGGERDELLFQKHPVVYKRIFTELKNSFSETSSGLTAWDVYTNINHAIPLETVNDILANAKWATFTGEKYVFSSDSFERNENLNTNEEDAIFEIDFNEESDLSYTKPLSFSYFGKLTTCQKSSWAHLYLNLMTLLIQDYPTYFKPGMSFSKTNACIELANSSDYSFMRVPRPIPGTDYMLETNISASHIVLKLKNVLKHCAIAYENIVIRYTKKASLASHRVENRITQTQYSSSINEISSVAFSQYMAEELHMAPGSCRSYASSINSCEVFAREHSFPSCRLYTPNKAEMQETTRFLQDSEEFRQYNAEQHNRFTAALKKFADFVAFVNPECLLEEVSVTPHKSDISLRNHLYEEVLKQNFQKGFRLDSSLEFRKFKKHYYGTHNTELVDTDEQIESIIRQLCIIFNNKAFLPSAMLSEELKERLLEYINVSLKNGKTALYYQAIYNEFQEAFLDHYIYDANMLRSYLEHLDNGQFFCHSKYVSKERDFIIDPIQEIRACLQEFGRPVEYNELFKVLSHLPPNKIQDTLKNNLEFVSNGSHVCFHESLVHLSDEELEDVSQIIRQTIEEKQFISGNELYDAIKSKYPFIIENNQAISVHGFRDALKAKIGSSFSFKGNIISRLDHECSMGEVFADFARRRDSFTIQELEALAKSLNTPIYFEPVYENSLRISQGRFISKKQVQFPIAEIDEAIDRVCVGHYIPIKAVINLAIFPFVGFTWNEFLLEHFVAHYSKKYILLHNGFNKVGCTGAIVKCSADVNTFDDLLVDLLINNPVEMNKDSALQFFKDKGYLARRQYSTIESIVIKAKALKKDKK